VSGIRRAVVLTRTGVSDAADGTQTAKEWTSAAKHEHPAASDSGVFIMDSSFCDSPAFELHFQSLFDPGRGFTFPCDVAGRVVIDALRERERHNYLYARALVGHDFASPRVRPREDALPARCGSELVAA
jgi:hypothetical protein